MSHISPLKGIVCVITRPKHQAKHLCQLLTDAGAQCILFPTIEIHSRPLDIKPLSHADKIIFVSANAVTEVLTHFSPPDGYFSSEIPVFAIGEGTKRALAAHNIDAIIPNNHLFNSEGLLVHPMLQSVAGEHIIIFSGEGGRRVLFETLQKRHAHVQQIPVYKRVRPKKDIMSLLEKEIDYIISASGESLENLWKMAGEKNQSWLVKQQLVVVSDRMKALADNLGFLYPALVSSNASDTAIFQAILLASTH